MSELPSLPQIAVAGTYDGGIVGWERREGKEDGASFHTLFAFTPHQGSVRALAIPQQGNKAGHLLVSGGSDEHIRLYDLRRRAETGELLYHKGTVTCLSFVGSTHLLSAGDDGIICIWRVHDWSLLHVLGGHKGSINGLAVHPSGKLALSGGRDRTLRLWDLVNGRCAYISRLEGAVSQVRWSPQASFYAVLLDERTLQVRQTSDNSVKASCQPPQRVTAIEFLSEGLIMFATEELHLCQLDVDKNKIVSTTTVKARVKDMSVEGPGRVLAAFSDGRVALLVKDSTDEGEGMYIGGSVSIGDGVRIISLAAFNPQTAVKSVEVAKGHDEEEGEEEEEEEQQQQQQAAQQERLKKRSKMKEKKVAKKRRIGEHHHHQSHIDKDSKKSKK